MMVIFGRSKASRSRTVHRRKKVAADTLGENACDSTLLWPQRDSAVQKNDWLLDAYEFLVKNCFSDCTPNALNS